MKRKICVVITARPSYSRIKTALQAIQTHPDLELQLVIGGSALLSRYGDTVGYIQADGFKIAAKVYMVVEGENPITSAKSTGLSLVELATIFDNLAPDMVVTIADRFETLANAVAAAYMNIPVVHIQGGEVTGSIDEKVRHAVTKFANLHFVSTRLAADRVVRMGERPDSVFVTGCPSVDLVTEMLNDTPEGFDPFVDYGGVGPRLDLSKGYLIVLQHPVTTEHQEAYHQALQTLQVVQQLNLSTFWFWPNVDAGSDGTSKAIRVFREQHRNTNIHFFRNMAPLDFLKLMYNSLCIVGNSSVGIRECSFMGLPAVNIGTRQSGRERGKNVKDVDYEQAAILAAIESQLAHGRYAQDTLYGDGQAGQRIAKLLATCTPLIEKRLTY